VFPESSAGQFWKSLETGLLHQAQVMLRAEVAHFDVRVAQACESMAAQWAADLKQKMLNAAPVRTSATVPKPASPAVPLKLIATKGPKTSHTMRHLFEAWTKAGGCSRGCRNRPVLKGINYLVRVAVDIESEADAEDQAVSLDYVMRTMEEGGAKFNVARLLEELAQAARQPACLFLVFDQGLHLGL
jgi:hypothetical protein